MPSWTELIAEVAPLPPPAREQWFRSRITEWLQKLSEKRLSELGIERNVLFYGSAFLQKPQISPAFLQIAPEDINAFMSAMHGMDWSKGLTLVLHTPGGSANAAETIVEYLHQKFDYIEVVIPTYAMSAGTMVCLAADRLLMGRQSQLGPIDPQMRAGAGSVSAGAIVAQFKLAKTEILKDPRMAAVWAPALQHLGPALFVEARKALDYGEAMVRRWLAQRQFKGKTDAARKAAAVAKYFTRSKAHKSHGRRIDRNEARLQGLAIEDIEEDQALQDIILTAYHLATLAFELSPCIKLIATSHGKGWVKSLALKP